MPAPKPEKPTAKPAAAKPAVAATVDLARARAHWQHAQGLAAPVKGSLEAVVAATGWPRTLGGVDVYLSMRARVPGLRQQDLNRAVAESRLQVIPAVRGCIYLVPRAEVPLVLRVAEDASRRRSARDLEKVGVTPKEVERIAAGVLAVLDKPKTTDTLRKALPDGLVRSLGEKGKKLGMSSPLPSALRDLEFAGKIERTPVGHRLDTERYEWRKRAASTPAKIPDDPAWRHAAVARAFFRSSGPATAQDFAAWSGLALRDARDALARVALVPVAVTGYAGDALVLEEQLAALREATPTTAISFLAFEDNYLVLHGGPALVVDPRYHATKVEAWGSDKGTTLGTVKHLAARALLVGDTVAGFWEWDAAAGRVIFGTFAPLAAKQTRAVENAAEGLTALLTELGHARSFSLDTDEEVAKRAAVVRKLKRQDARTP